MVWTGHSCMPRSSLTRSATQEWSNGVSKGKAGRYGVRFSWDVANIDNLTDWSRCPP